MIEDTQGDIVSAVVRELRSMAGSGVVLLQEHVDALERKLRIDWGGQALYVKKVAVDVAARRAAIYSRYDMTNRRELQAEFGISRGQFYKDLRAAAKEAAEAARS